MTNLLVRVGEVLVSVPVRIVPKQILLYGFRAVDFSTSAVAASAQFFAQCLRIVLLACPLRIVAAAAVVRYIQRLFDHRLLVAEAAMSSASSNAMKVRKPEPAEIEYKNMKFLITYRPTDATMDRFIEVSSQSLPVKFDLSSYGITMLFIQD